MPPAILKAKVCLVGESFVGKTSLARRFVLDQFDDRYRATLGAKISKKLVSAVVGGEPVHVVFTVWDIMGEASFRELLKDAYFGGSQGVLAVADLGRPATVEALPAWIDAARSSAGRIPVVLVGNKADLSSEPGVGLDLEGLARLLEAPVRRTSAKTGEGVEAAFRDLATAIASRAADETVESAGRRLV